MRLKGKISIITGAAHGMGESTARRFAREGAVVVIADVLDAEGAKVAAEINAQGGKADYAHLDVTQEAEWKSLVASTVQRHGRLDILVNNAGISGAVPDRMDVAMFDRLMNVNARGTFLGIKYGIEAMLKTGGGSIVNLSSISGLVGQEFVHMGYNAAKAGIHLLTKSAALQFGKDGIRVNSVHPGLIETPIWLGIVGRPDGGNAPPDLDAMSAMSVPLGVKGLPLDIANAVLWLASDQSRYVNGAELVIDGGLSIR